MIKKTACILPPQEAYEASDPRDTVCCTVTR